VARYFAAHFVSAHQQVGSFEVVNEFGTLDKTGGNVASYFCTPDGQVIHAVTGPVTADELLAAARWAVEVSSDGRAANDAVRIAAAHRDECERPRPPGTEVAQFQVHRLLAEQPLAPLNEVYRTVFERILRQRVSPPDAELPQVEKALAAANRAKLPILLILHRERDSQEILRHWRGLVSPAGGPQANLLAVLARSYVVVALPMAELPALSQHLAIPPYATPDKGSLLLVIARSDARQLNAVTTWNNAGELAYAMAEGLVQEAKEHDRKPEQLRDLIDEVGLVDYSLATQVRQLLVLGGSADHPPGSAGPARRGGLSPTAAARYVPHHVGTGRHPRRSL
jgi:hypothetical protein